jgi:hypothetical protein
MNDFDITTISDSDLCEAGNRLQKAHDYIEANGFNIETYGFLHENAPCCFIGSVKVAGGEDGQPWSDEINNAVRAALHILDEVDGGCCGESYPGGRIEESYLRTGLSQKTPQSQAEVAIPIYRDALRAVVGEMEKRNISSKIKEIE